MTPSDNASNPIALDLPPRLLGALSVATEVMAKYFDAEVRGLGRLPPGPALLVGNHSGTLVTPDSFVFAGAFLRHTRFQEPLVALAHDAVFRIPIVNDALRKLGLVPAAPNEALRALRAGHKVLVYPGGSWEATRPSRDRDRIDFKERLGFLRIAAQAKVPIVPVVSAGAHDGFHVLTRGDGIARFLRLDKLFRFDTFPIALGLPTGLVIGPHAPYFPLPRKMILEVLGPRTVTCRADSLEELRGEYRSLVASMQETLTRLALELPRSRRLRAARTQISRR